MDGVREMVAVRLKLAHALLQDPAKLLQVVRMLAREAQVLLAVGEPRALELIRGLEGCHDRFDAGQPGVAHGTREESPKPPPEG